MQNEKAFRQARLSDDFTCVIDSDGNRVDFDDPKVTHIFAIDCGNYLKCIFRNILEKRGWRTRITGGTTREVLHLGKRLCSGRECLPFTVIAGLIHKDILEHRRGDDEILIYYSLDQEGPCQVGGWPLLWDTIGKRLNLKNIVYVASPNIKNNYLGQGEMLSLEMGAGIVLGDLLEEAEFSLRCLATDPESALSVFERETGALIEHTRRGVVSTECALKAWAKKIRAIPLRSPVADAPKVLLFGGLNVTFVHRPISDYFVSEGIIPKIVDQTEGICHIESEYGVRYGFQKAIFKPRQQFRILRAVLSFFDSAGTFRKKVEALRSILHIWVLFFLKKRYWKKTRKSGVLFDKPTSFISILEQGHNLLSYNSLSEASSIVGKYLSASASGVYDGLLQIGAYNCQPALNAQAVVRPLANRSDIPYASIDLEGPWLSEMQGRLMESVAAQIREFRKEKAASESRGTPAAASGEGRSRRRQAAACSDEKVRSGGE